MKAYFTILLFVLIDLLNISFAQLESIGPYGGYIRCLTKDNNENVLAGTLYGGIYITSDVGENWTQIFYGHRNLDVRSLAVSPDNIYFAGTDGGGLYRSIDQGKTWEITNSLFSNETIRTILALGNNIILVGTFDGLFKSTDNGKTFSSSSKGITTNSISCLAYSGTFFLAGTDYNGIFISIDTAKNWQPVNEGLDYNNRTVESIAFSENTKHSKAESITSLKGSTRIMVASLGDKVFQGQIPSLPDSIRWTAFPSPPKYIETVKFKDDNSIIGAATSNITSAGGGIVTITINDTNSTWKVEDVPDFPYSSIEITSRGPIAATYGNGAATIQVFTKSKKPENKGMAATSINKIYYGDGTILAATEFSGLFKSINLGISWEDITKNLYKDGINGFNDVAVNKSTGTTFTATVSGTYRLPQNDTSWQNIKFDSRTIGVNDPGTVFFGNGANIGYSFNDGVTINKTFVNNITNVYNFAFRKDTVNISSDNGVYTSVPPYTNWTPDGLQGETVTYVVSIDNSWTSNECLKNIVLLAGTNNGKIYRRDYNGQYTSLSSGLYATDAITSICPVPRFFDTNEPYDMILARPPKTPLPYPFATSSKFDFNNCEWKEELVSDYVTRILSHENLYQKALLKGEQTGQYVLYGTLGTGILIRDLTTDVKNNVVNFPTEFSLRQNYPNPFNPSTTIEFSIPQQSFVTLKVYDLLGREVASLVNEELKAGLYNTQFNVSNLASGVYLYRLNANGITQTRKLTVIK